MQLNRRSFIASALSAGAMNIAGGDAIAQSAVGQPSTAATGDWLIDPIPYIAKVKRSTDGKEVELSNGLVRRVFCLTPNAATIALDNLITGESLLRAVRPEAEITVNDYKMAIGGLSGAPIQNYLLTEWLDEATADPHDFRFVKLEEGKTVERFPWKRVPEWSTEVLPWPPPGVSLTFHYEPGPRTPLADLRLRICYELYDGIPLMAKWMELENRGHSSVMLNSFKAEILALMEASTSEVGPTPPNGLIDRIAPLHVETDYAFGGEVSAARNQPAVHWKQDPQYGSDLFDHGYPSLVECSPAVGPELEIAPEGQWRSFRVFELVHDSSEMERRGLATRRMAAMLAPWSQENPIFMHARNAAPDKARQAIDQCAAVGFEMVILSFGSGFNIEDDSAHNLEEMKALVEYARQKGIAIGGYSLLASRGGEPRDLDIDIATGKPGQGRFGLSPCLGSLWAKDYFNKLHRFFSQTGMNVFENDGSYPGDYCASCEHPGHRGYLDSQWRQWMVMSEFYRWCRGQGIYLTVPDWYFLNGSSKTSMGYTENDWSLPRQYQPLIERQNIYDGTWDKTPSMGWMHVPLMQYHAGGSQATVEPLHDNLPHYETRLADLFCAGVQAAWRGERLYDTEETRIAVKKWVDFYKQHRAILNSDIIHLRRPDGRDWDGILHVNPRLETRGLAIFYNPLDRAITREIRLPLYYTGLEDKASIRERGGNAKTYFLDRGYRVTISVSIPPQSRTCFFVQ